MSLRRVNTLALYHAEQIGTDDARTLSAWRQRFHRQINVDATPVTRRAPNRVHTDS